MLKFEVGKTYQSGDCTETLMKCLWVDSEMALMEYVKVPTYLPRRVGYKFLRDVNSTSWKEYIPPVEVWINVYSGRNHYGHLFNSREAAVEGAGATCVGRMKLTLVPGQWDE